MEQFASAPGQERNPERKASIEKYLQEAIGIDKPPAHGDEEMDKLHTDARYSTSALASLLAEQAGGDGMATLIGQLFELQRRASDLQHTHTTIGDSRRQLDEIVKEEDERLREALVVLQRMFDYLSATISCALATQPSRAEALIKRLKEPLGKIQQWFLNHQPPDPVELATEIDDLTHAVSSAQIVAAPTQLSQSSLATTLLASAKPVERLQMDSPNS